MRSLPRPSSAITVRQLQKYAEKKLRQWTAPIRCWPDFIIIGTQKGGTTSLYDCLTQHPWVVPARVKEIRFFSRHFHKGPAWYRTNFPTQLLKAYATVALGNKPITGEATPYYMFHPLAPKRISRLVPQAKFIALLRNPVDRAYSHYQHVVRKGRETLSFEEAVEAEPERLRGERKRMLADESYRGLKYGFYSYLARGFYVDQLKVWFNLFPREQILILNSESFFSDQAKAYRRVLAFLDLPEQKLQKTSESNVGRYPQMRSATRARLTEYFRPYNEQLYDLIGQEYSWD
jgi:hypothetical protein